MAYSRQFTKPSQRVTNHVEPIDTSCKSSVTDSARRMSEFLSLQLLSTHRKRPFQSLGRKRPNPKLEFIGDCTRTEVAHKAGRPTGLIGYGRFPGGTSKDAFSATLRTNSTLAPAGSVRWIAAKVQSWALEMLSMAQ